ncbi:MAG: ABC transporter permease [Acidobacteria bacterium]|nr:ABC transporter permease [Acidobacteriota bacterium]
MSPSEWYWSLRMAWRDTRGSRFKLFFFSLTVTLGIAALVATSGFGSNLQRAVATQAKSLLGADLVLSANNQLPEDIQALTQGLAGPRSRWASFASMAYFPAQDQARLARVRALEGEFPYYGALETDPPQARLRFDHEAAALVDDGLMTQFDLKVDDRVKIGEQEFVIAGRLLKIPGESAMASAVGPRIYIPFRYLDQTRLVQFGSRIRYATAFLADGWDPDQWLETHEKALRAARVSFDTVKIRKENLGNAFENLETFLSLVGLAALVLGGIGIASSVHLYANRKIETLAVLRCLGGRTGLTMWIPIWVSLGMALIGVLGGVLLGLTIQWVFPLLFQAWLPVDLDYQIDAGAAGLVLVLGVVLAGAFTLLPLSSVWFTTPVALFRKGTEPDVRATRRLRRLLGFLLIFCLMGFIVIQAQRPLLGLLFGGGILLLLALLFGLSWLLLKLLKRFRFRRLPPMIRMALANLHRPHNQSALVMLALGLGGFLILNHTMVHQSLIAQFTRTGSNDRPNMILFDIQSDQVDALQSLLTRQTLPKESPIPMVTMRIQSLKGKPIREWIGEDESTQVPEWAALWEYRSTYRAEQSDTEEIIAGEWVSHFSGQEAVPLSLEESIAETLHLTVGDEVVLDVQGVPFTCRIQSLRKVDWQSMKPNFYMVFPAGVLEEAPQMFVQAVQTPSSQAAAELQKSLFIQFPNISSVDLRLLLKTIDDIVRQATFAIRFMALFFVGTALFVLGSCLVNSRQQRLDELAILRALGAHRSQVRILTMSEYGFLGFLSALFASGLALLSSYLITHYGFRVDWVWNPSLILWAVLGSVLLTTATGLMTELGWNPNAILERLRAEVR